MKGLPIGNGTRRDVLRAIGAAAGGAALIGRTGAEDESRYSLVQNDRCVPVTPLSGSVPVEELYNYQLPEGKWTGTVGASDDGGPYYSSEGTTDLLREDTSVLFLYDGPNGVSLVIAHGKPGGSSRGGGSASFEMSGLPEDGRWVVRDDHYLDPDTGEPAGTNYDEWQRSGTTNTVGWTWGDGGTDGGAFRGLGSGTEITIEPAFNDAAMRLDDNYDGEVTDWQVLSGSLGDPDRTSLSLDSPVTIASEACSARTGSETPDSASDGRTGERTSDGERTGDADARDEAEEDAEAGEETEDEGSEAEEDESEADEGEREEKERRGDSEEDGEYEVCHRPPGNPDNAHTIAVGSENALETHLGHGDRKGPCDDRGED